MCDALYFESDEDIPCLIIPSENGGQTYWKEGMFLFNDTHSTFYLLIAIWYQTNGK